MNRKLDTLIKKRENLEAEIALAQAIQLRIDEVIALPEFVAIISLDNKILRDEFSRIASEMVTAPGYM